MRTGPGWARRQAMGVVAQDGLLVWAAAADGVAVRARPLPPPLAPGRGALP